MFLQLDMYLTGYRCRNMQQGNDYTLMLFLEPLLCYHPMCNWNKVVIHPCFIPLVEEKNKKNGPLSMSNCEFLIYTPFH